MRTCLSHLLLLLVVFIQLTFATAFKADTHSNFPQKRDIKEEWEDLGWAWGKRSDPSLVMPRRLVRAYRPVKKNPDWGDLGWTWGRR